jgi:hypothetical protein
MLTDLRLCDCESALGRVPIENAGLKRKTDYGKTYFRSLLDPTPVMLQRLDMPLSALRQLKMYYSTSPDLGAASLLSRPTTLQPTIDQHTTSISHASHHRQSFGRSKRRRYNRHIRQDQLAVLPVLHGRKEREERYQARAEKS